LNTKLFYFNSYANLFYRFSTNSATFKQNNAFFRLLIRFKVEIRIPSPDGRIRVLKAGICSHPVNKFYMLLIICYLNDFSFKKILENKKILSLRFSAFATFFSASRRIRKPKKATED